MSIILGTVIAAQVLMAVVLGMIVVRNGRNGGTYRVASDTSRPYELPPKSAAPAKELYENIPLDATLLELDKRALNEAYHGQLILLWSVWLKDGAGDPSRFQNGLKIARRAYHTAVEQIEKREREAEAKKRP